MSKDMFLFFGSVFVVAFILTSAVFCYDSKRTNKIGSFLLPGLFVAVPCSFILMAIGFVVWIFNINL